MPIQTVPSIGGVIANSTTGSVLFAAGGVFAQDNTNLFWNQTTKDISIGQTYFHASINTREFMGNLRWTNTSAQRVVHSFSAASYPVTGGTIGVDSTTPTVANSGPITLVSRFMVPSTNPSTSGGIVGISTSTTLISGNSFFYFISTAGELIVRLTGSTTSDFRQLAGTANNLVSQWAGQVIWVHAIRNGTAAPTVYVNGIAQTMVETTGGTAPTDWGQAVSGTNFIIGIATASAASFNQRIYTGRAYNIALTMAEVLQEVQKSISNEYRWGSFRNVVIYKTAYTDFSGGTTPDTNDSTFAGAGNWVNSTMATFDVNTTVAGKAYFLLPASGAAVTNIASTLVIGNYYRVTLKLQNNPLGGAAQTIQAIRIGSSTSTAASYVSITPTASEATYSGTFLADGTTLRVGVGANSNSTDYSMDDIVVQQIGCFIDSDLEQAEPAISTRIADIANSFTGTANASPLQVEPTPQLNAAFIRQNGGTNRLGASGTTSGPFNAAATTYIDNTTAGSGTASSFAFYSWSQPTLSATNTLVTTTNAATLYIAAAPANGTNMTITNPYALWIDAGNVRVDGNLYFATSPPATGDAVVYINNNITLSTFNSTNGSLLRVSSAAITDAFNTSGTVSSFVGSSFSIPTLTNASVVTYTEVANVYIAGAPTMSGSALATNSWALWIDAGNTRFDGNIRSYQGSGGVFELRRNDNSVTASDVLGVINFQSEDTSTTTNFIAAQIEAQAVSTITTDINPGRLIFRTTGTGVAATPTEALRITQNQGLLHEREVVAQTVGATLGSAFDYNTVYTNEGSSARVDNVLPTASVGITYTAYIQDTDGMRITAAAGDTIRVAASVSGVAGYIESTTIGSSVTLVAINATEWVSVATNGTWTVV